MIPSALSAQLQQGLMDFLRYSFWSSTPGMERVIDDLLEEAGGVTKGPYLSVKLPFESGGRADFFPEVPLPYPPHAHQTVAFERLGGRRKLSTLVATGTGSGKTECFLLPILDHCLKEVGTPGVKAILIYPMNALATDQAWRIARMVHGNERLRGKITAGLYIGETEGAGGGGGGDGGGGGGGKGRRGGKGGGNRARRTGEETMSARSIITDRATLQRHPPDILLTNYKMLDYLLLRPWDRGIWQDNHRGVLRMLVVDELHTFDGAKGTDLACLIRRLKRRLQADDGSLCCVGTSATLGGESSRSQLRIYAQEVFGEPFDEGALIGETRKDARAFLADAQVEYTEEPGVADLAALGPAMAGSPQQWVRAQRRLWFGHEGSLEPAWEVALGEQLKRHATFRALLELLDGRVVGVDEVVQALSRARSAWRKNPELGRLAVQSMMGLVSVARSLQPELGAAREARETRGDAAPTRPFLEVRLQLWQRELGRMVSTVGAPGTVDRREQRPRLRFSDDLDRKQRRSHLPLVHCRDCGAMGWATRIDRDKPQVFRCELYSFYRAFFRADPQVRLLYPRAAVPEGDPAWDRHPVVRVDTQRLVRLDSEDEPEPGGAAAELVVVANTRTVERGKEQERKQALHRDCPFCGARESLALVGFRAATLTSMYVDQIFASRFNDERDKKLLTFSDSVQDAAHRAGFFGARTWRTNLRVALRRVLQEGNEGVALSELPGVFGAYFRERMDEPTWVATFIAPNMAWLHDWDALKRDGALPEGSNLSALVRRRLAFEIAQEFGHQATIGRSLPRTRAATAYLAPERLEAACEALVLPMQNEVPGLRDVGVDELRAFVVGLIHHLRTRGAIHHAELPAEFLESGGENIFQFKRQIHLPAFGRTSRLPAFLQDRPGSRRFDTWSSSKGRQPGWYERWVMQCFASNTALGADASSVYPVALAVLSAQGVLHEILGKRGERIWGVADEALRVESTVKGLCCARCHHRVQVAASEVDLWREVPCLTARCTGRYETDEADTADYFGRLYSVGDLQRIYTAEHTGLLSREERERIELEFKAESASPASLASGLSDDGALARKPWFPNLLSCTPTLEMGIDIGDLSSTILCSVPPTQANYLQRIGRTGRRDGNSLVISVANARPHDLYMFSAPQEMMAGDVTPPGVFLDASAVLERQLTAFCFDRWVAKEGDAAVLPRRLGEVFAHLDDEGSFRFPRNLLAFVERNQPAILREFQEMFAGAITETTRHHLQTFLEGGDMGEASLQWRLLEACQRERKQRESLRSKAHKITSELKKLNDSEAKPLDFDDQIDRLEEEKAALQALIRQMDGRQTLEFFTDEGLLPNYAFPESAVRLSSVIWRKKKRVPSQGSKYDTWTYEYARSPSSALTELAPQADFYAGGRRVRIDRVDVSVTEVETWRFCDLCNHAQRIDFGDQPTSCPACDSATWVDDDQRLRLLPLRQVFANAPDRESRIRDDRDDRQPRYFQRQILVQYRDEDRQGAWSIDDPAVPFGFEYLARATFREVNFGEHSDQGRKFRVAGREAARPGFQICARCGKVQQEGKEPQHTLSCPTHATGAKPSIETCLYLYREFSSEALRLLLPLFELAQLNTFVAALQLGLKARFGGSVDHLRTTVYSEPDSDSSLRKQYLVLFDSVPGGTGYVKQLVTPAQEGAELPLFEALELARERLESCSCWSDPERDGCYQCLLGYRNARDMDDVSARTAVEQIREILGKRHKLEQIESLSDVSVRGLMDSVLEARFIEALGQATFKGQPAKLRPAIVNRKPGYRLTLGAQEWVVEPQVDVGPAGLGMKISIDFVLRPGSATAKGEHRPIAVFTDGWKYHKSRIGLDLLQRMVLMASGQWDVWSFTWWDLDEVLTNKPSSCANLSHPDPKQLRDLLGRSGPAGHRDVAERPIFQTFISELGKRSPSPWEHIGDTLLASRMSLSQETDIDLWTKAVSTYAPAEARPLLAASQAKLSCIDDGESNPWVSLFAVHDGSQVLTLVVLDDREENLEEPGFRETWNGFLRLFQLLRFQANAWFVTRSWLDGQDYTPVIQHRSAPGEVPWADMDEIEDEFLPLCKELMAAGLPQPDIGVDVPGQAGRIWSEAELLWEKARVVVTDRRRVKDAQGQVADGWQVFLLEDLHNAEKVVTALKKKGGS